MNSESKSKNGIRLFPGIWIVLGVLILIGTRLVWGYIHYPHQLKRLAKELSSINVIQKAPVVNHARTLAGVIHTTEQGVGVFIVDVKTKEERKLVEVKDVDYASTSTWAFGWSPDDKFFAFSIQTNLHFLDGSGKKSINDINLTNGIQPFAWLSSTACAYIDEDPKLVILQFINGQWRQTASWLLPTTDGKPRSLLAMGTNSVAWQTDSTLWQLETSTGAIKPVYSNSPKIIGSISYSKNTDMFLVVENTNRTTTSSLLTISNGGDFPLVKEIARKPSIISAQWINRGKGYACVINRGDNTVLTVKKGDASEDTFFTGGQVWNIFCDGEDSCVYALAAQTNEPAGVWQYDASADTLACIVSPWGDRDVKFHYQPMLVGWVKYKQDGQIHDAKFNLIPPSDFSRKKKYPLVIGTASYEWTPIAHGVYAQCLANCGAYVALVSYRWDQTRSETIFAHTNNVLAVYNQLAKSPNVDTNRVYLFGFSAGTLVTSELIKDYPGGWRGIMLLNPSQLPEAKEGMTLRVLATAGSGEGEEERFRHYQEELLKVGIPMEWHIHANAQHVVRDQGAMCERTLFMGNMIFKN
jgi:dipeptidyl aminopeptidase/acylaminoacyl peptidase